MQIFTTHTGSVAPLDRPYVDTDAIIPKQFLKSIKRSGSGPNAFDDWRYLDAGGPDIDNATRRPNPDFVLNRQPCDTATILLARDNFGCGSSREHAVWALADSGFRAVIAPGFADIYFNNSFNNELLPITLDTDTVEWLFRLVETSHGFEIAIDLRAQTLTVGDELIGFEIDAFRKHCLLNGFDDIDLTVQHAGDLRNHQQVRRQSAPWLF